MKEYEEKEEEIKAIFNQLKRNIQKNHEETLKIKKDQDENHIKRT